MTRKTMIPGEKFGRLSFIEASADIGGRTSSSFMCDCGTVVIRKNNEVRRGKSISCGCYRHDKLVERNSKHGQHMGNGYICWIQMRARCRDKNHQSYARYGGRGISVCERWDKFENFVSDMGERPSPKHTIDRINNDGDYEPKNCRWATRSEQARNRSSNKLFPFRGHFMTTWEIGELVGLSRREVYQRIRLGRPVVAA